MDELETAASQGDNAAGGAAPAEPGNIDRFPVIRLLGHGGMGEVFLSRHPVTGVDVAVKRLKPRLAANAEAVRRFLAEARHMYHLNHPRLLRVMEVWNPPGGPYFVVPYMPAGSLASKLKPGEPAEEVFALHVALDVAEGVAFAHTRGIIHRDLKPGNVLLDEEGRAYLCDFGLVGEFTTNDSVNDKSFDVCEGTVPYMSPAVARGEAEDTRCDIYSFGAMLYEMLTGHLPYGPTKSRQKIVAGPPPTILERNPHAPRALTAVAEACMARELRDRYANMNDVLADLRRVAGGKPPVGPHGSAARDARWPLAAIVVTLLVFIAATTFAILHDRFRSPPTTATPVQAVQQPDTAAARHVDLLSQVDLATDCTPPDTATRVADGIELACTPDHFRSSIVFPAMPLGDYDLRIEFTRMDGEEDGLDHSLVYQGRPFMWTLAGNQSTMSSFWRVGDKGFGTNATQVTRDQYLENGERHVSEIQVRNGSVTALLDGIRLTDWLPRYGMLSFPKADEIPDVWHGRLGLSVLHSKWLIHRVTLTEYSMPR